MLPNSEHKNEQPEIRTLVDPITNKVWSIEFSEANTDTIREIMQAHTYGKTEAEVTIIAVSLLYSIFKITTKCEFITIIDESGKPRQINMPKLG